MGGDVIADVNYLIKTTDGCPAWLQSAVKTAYSVTNFGQVPTSVTIHDLRGKEANFDLDTHAFKVIKYEGLTQEVFAGDSDEQRAYYEEINELIKKSLGASRVITYHHVFRSRGAPQTAEQCSSHRRNPGFLVHSDIDGPGSRQKIKELLGEEEGERAIQGRHVALNIWRPLGVHPITDKPLAICDYRSVDVEKDIHPLELRGSVNSTSAQTISPGVQDAHQWYYISDMRSNEMFVFKMFDSQNDVAQTAFHTAFINKNVPPSDVEQKSLEMRCLVFYD